MIQSGHTRLRLIVLLCLGLLPFLVLLLWSVASSLEVQKEAADRVENVARLLKYAGMLLTAVFTAGCVLTETVDRSKRGTREIVLTLEGKIFVIVLYLSVLITATSAVFQDKADDRVRYWERQDGNEDVRKSFDAEIKMLTPDLKKQGESLKQQSARLEEQKKSIENATTSIRNSGKFMATMVLRTGRELEFANHQFKDLSLALSIEDPVNFESQEPEHYTALGKQLLKYRDDTCNIVLTKPRPKEEECKAAQDSFNRWNASNELRRYLDPTGQLDLEISLYFVGFTVDGSTEGCAMARGEYSNSKECFVFELLPSSTEGRKTDLSYETALGPLLLGRNVLFKFEQKDGFEQAFSEDGIPGRDASFLTLFVEACDEEESQSLQVAARRARQLRSNVKFLVTVTGVDKLISRDIPNGYQLREFDREVGRSTRCVRSAYTNAPENLLPKNFLNMNKPR
jgi:hypothetical protein